MPNYHNAFLRSEFVRLVSIETLLDFQREWGEYCHKPTDDQLQFAGRNCVIRDIMYEHGGDTLYELGIAIAVSPDPNYEVAKVPGVWHEDCLLDLVDEDNSVTVLPASETYVVEAQLRLNQPVIVVRTKDGIECLVKRWHDNMDMSETMNQVAQKRSVRGFEVRYDFDGLAHDKNDLGRRMPI